jgi:hypothetical protein
MIASSLDTICSKKYHHLQWEQIDVLLPYHGSNEKTHVIKEYTQYQHLNLSQFEWHMHSPQNHV